MILNKYFLKISSSAKHQQISSTKHCKQTQSNRQQNHPFPWSDLPDTFQYLQFGGVTFQFTNPLSSPAAASNSQNLPSVPFHFSSSHASDRTRALTACPQSANDDVVARQGSVDRVDGTVRSSMAIVKRRGHDAAAPSVCSLKTALRGLFKNPKAKHVVTLSFSCSTCMQPPASQPPHR